MGYTTIETVPGFNMAGCSYKGLGEETISLNDLLQADFDVGDQVQVYSGGAYTYYTYDVAAGWKKGRVSADEAPLKAGDSFWLNTPGRSLAVTMKGAVSTADVYYVGTRGFQMVSVSIPVALHVNEALWEGLTDGDQIQVLDPSTGAYVYYSYRSMEGKWYKGRQPVPEGEVIPVGASFWLMAQNEGVVLRVESPIK